MNKSVLITIAAIILLPMVAAGLQVTETEKSPVVIAELNNPAVFEFAITNEGQPEGIEIYSLVGIDFNPRGSFELPAGKTTLEVKAYPSAEVRKKEGIYAFEYQVKGEMSGITKESLTIRIVHLADTLQVWAEPLTFGDKNAVIHVKNLQNTQLDQVTLHFNSVFFENTKTIPLKSYETVDVQIPIDNSKLATILAGQYVFKASVKIGKAEVVFDNTLQYQESEKLSYNEDSSGLVVKKLTMTKTNIGNVPVTASIDSRQNIISRLFTVHSFEPIKIERDGFYVTYHWEKLLTPASSFSVTTTTNYTLPVIFLALIILTGILVGVYTRTSVIVTKRVFFVRTKGEEFALKVRIRVKSRQQANDVQVIDRLPGMTQLYEKFGTKPDKIEASSRRLIWNIPRLSAGEERVFSYIVYSKMKIVGRFELPSTTVLYESNGKTEEIFSNRTFFVSETAARPEF